jgi:hypothetical protein
MADNNTITLGEYNPNYNPQVAIFAPAGSFINSYIDSTGARVTEYLDTFRTNFDDDGNFLGYDGDREIFRTINMAYTEIEPPEYEIKKEVTEPETKETGVTISLPKPSEVQKPTLKSVDSNTSIPNTMLDSRDLQNESNELQRQKIDAINNQTKAISALNENLKAIPKEIKDGNATLKASLDYFSRNLIHQSKVSNGLQSDSNQIALQQAGLQKQQSNYYAYKNSAQIPTTDGKTMTPAQAEAKKDVGFFEQVQDFLSTTADDLLGVADSILDDDLLDFEDFVRKILGDYDVNTLVNEIKERYK